MQIDFVVPVTVSKMKQDGSVEKFSIVGEQRNNIEGLPNLDNVVVIKKVLKLM